MKNADINRNILRAISIGLAATLVLVPNATAFAGEEESDGNVAKTENNGNNKNENKGDSESKSEHTEKIEKDSNDAKEASREVEKEERHENNENNQGGGEQTPDPAPAPVENTGGNGEGGEQTPAPVENTGGNGEGGEQTPAPAENTGGVETPAPAENTGGVETPAPAENTGGVETPAPASGFTEPNAATAPIAKDIYDAALILNGHKDTDGNPDSIAAQLSEVDKAYAAAVQADLPVVDSAKNMEGSLGNFDWMIGLAENAQTNAVNEYNDTKANVNTTVKPDIQKAADTVYGNQSEADAAKKEAESNLADALAAGNAAVATAQNNLNNAKEALGFAQDNLTRAQGEMKDADEKLKEAQTKFKAILKENGISCTENEDGSITADKVDDAKLSGKIKAAIDKAEAAVETAKNKADAAAEKVEKAKQAVDNKDDEYKKAAISAGLEITNNADAIAKTLTDANTAKEKAQTAVNDATTAKTNADSTLTTAQEAFDVASQNHSNKYDETAVEQYDALKNKYDKLKTRDDNRQLAYELFKIYLSEKKGVDVSKLTADLKNKNADGGFDVYITENGKTEKLTAFNWHKYVEGDDTPKGDFNIKFDHFAVVEIADGKETEVPNKLEEYIASKANLQTLQEALDTATAEANKAAGAVNKAETDLTEATAKAEAAQAAQDLVTKLGAITVNAASIKAIFGDENVTSFNEAANSAYKTANANKAAADEYYSKVENEYNAFKAISDKIVDQQAVVAGTKRDGSDACLTQYRELAALLAQYQLKQDLKNQGKDVSSIEMDVVRKDDKSIDWYKGSSSKEHYGTIKYTIDGKVHYFYFDYIGCASNDLDQNNILDDNPNNDKVDYIVVVQKRLLPNGDVDKNYKGDNYINETSYKVSYETQQTSLAYAESIKKYADAVAEYGSMLKIQKKAEEAKQSVEKAADDLRNAKLDELAGRAKIRSLEDRLTKAWVRYNEAEKKYNKVAGDFETLQKEIQQIIDSGFNKIESKDGGETHKGHHKRGSDEDTLTDRGGDTVTPDTAGGVTDAGVAYDGGTGGTTLVTGTADAALTGGDALGGGVTVTTPGPAAAVTTGDGAALAAAATTGDGAALAADETVEGDVLGDKEAPEGDVLGERLAPLAEAVDNGTFTRDMLFEDEARKLPFMWWLLLLILGAAGVKLYRDHLKKKNASGKQSR